MCDGPSSVRQHTYDGRFAYKKMAPHPTLKAARAERERSAQRRPKYPAMNKTMTTRPTSQMILFTILSFVRAGLRTSQQDGFAPLYRDVVQPSVR